MQTTAATPEQTAARLLRLRIERETQLSRAAKSQMLAAFDILSRIGYASSLPPKMFQFSKLQNETEVQKAVTDLVMWLYFNVVDLADKVIADTAAAYAVPLSLRASGFINQPLGGRTLRQRLRIYARRLLFEIEAWTAAGLLLGLSRQRLRDEFIQNSAHPYSNSLFRRASSIPSVAATRLRRHGKSFGVGQYSSAESSIIRLIRSTVASAHRQAAFQAFRKLGIAGFQVRRGSSYPCSLCDSMVGYHPLRFAELPPYHPNCCCIAIPIYTGRPHKTNPSA